ncbi:MAG: hypothetical protein IJ002_04215 [Clostridia bacterium]|nr:hypothetical protein [Clostridia bacterium]
MTPIEKNIFVVDEQGNEYEATYPKRAKGLVKNGRARFISENTICLACPPKEYLEDNKMSENTTLHTEEKTAKYSIGYILEQLELISKDTAYLNNVISELGKVVTGGSGDIGASDKATALGQVVKSREETNRKLIDFYQKMYDDLKPSDSLKQKALEIILSTNDYDFSELSDLFDSIRHLN